MSLQDKDAILTTSGEVTAFLKEQILWRECLEN